MHLILKLYIILPLIALCSNLVIYLIKPKLTPQKYEKYISGIALSVLFIQLCLIVIATVKWSLSGNIEFNWLEILASEHGQFNIALYLDKIAVVFLLLGSLLIFMIVRYSSYYMHRESNYSKFFSLLLFFDFGYSVVILAGNFGTFFIGWEFIGVSSFLLIAFYQERYLPVRNAIKIFALYRIGDISILLVIWASRYLWGEGMSFSYLALHYNIIENSVVANPVLFRVLTFGLIIAAAIKSAQLPFSNWLSRAMEGPTPSSAIFYGSLAVHLGAFILLRSEFLWYQLMFYRVIIIVIGLLTSIIATMIARVQASVKSQIAYSSIAQIGVIFIEIACGFDTLALFHIVGNACLRTYQLLISPSIVNYLIREQTYTYQPKIRTTYNSKLINKIKTSVYLLCVREFYLDGLINQIFWRPLKRCGRLFSFISIRIAIFILMPMYLICLWLYFHLNLLPLSIVQNMPLFFCSIGTIMVLKAFLERKNPISAWTMLLMNHFWVALAILYNSTISIFELLIYLNGVIIAGGIGYWALYYLKAREKSIECYQYLGHAYEYEKLSWVFLLAALGINSFPITTTFLGEDIVLSYILINQFPMIMLISFGFIVSGISSIRLYSRLFLGPHIKTYHSTSNNLA